MALVDGSGLPLRFGVADHPLHCEVKKVIWCEAGKPPLSPSLGKSCLLWLSSILVRSGVETSSAAEALKRDHGIVPPFLMSQVDHVIYDHIGSHQFACKP